MLNHGVIQKSWLLWCWLTINISNLRWKKLSRLESCQAFRPESVGVGEGRSQSQGEGNTPEIILSEEGQGDITER